ncbi:hypothetical protein L1987_51259 [Smallanthus sonchifolius]|uniref:Uncharacterized protein n=1 Tax=Smallanthus sonchifolius TaxID=185202 RepID=A0ACB9EPI9_9ASTR|nr:hypothetical protein L1987_51259 [Smallanthus sonchifolius]
MPPSELIAKHNFKVFCKLNLCVLFDKKSESDTMLGKEFFTEYGEASLYEIQEVVGKGISYDVVADAVDTQIASSQELPACKRILTPKWVISATTGDFSIHACDYCLHTYKTCFKPLPLVM